MDWSLIGKYDEDILFSLGALCCAIYRDFSVSETRLYEKKHKTIIKRRKVQTNFPRYQAIVEVQRNGTALTGDVNVVKNDRVTYQISNHDPNNENDFSDD